MYRQTSLDCSISDTGTCHRWIFVRSCWIIWMLTSAPIGFWCLRHCRGNMPSTSNPRSLMTGWTSSWHTHSYDFDSRIYFNVVILFFHSHRTEISLIKICQWSEDIQIIYMIFSCLFVLDLLNLKGTTTKSQKNRSRIPQTKLIDLLAIRIDHVNHLPGITVYAFIFFQNLRIPCIFYRDLLGYIEFRYRGIWKKKSYIYMYIYLSIYTTDDRTYIWNIHSVVVHHVFSKLECAWLISSSQQV